jgi:hypothetical protein
LQTGFKYKEHTSAYVVPLTILLNTDFSIRFGKSSYLTS